MGQEPRRLEIAILCARGLQPASQGGRGGVSLGESRRKVQITLVNSDDPDGEGFGAKVSPWTEVAPGGTTLRFGRSGLRCSFPLETQHGAPAAVANPRFAEMTRVRVRLLTSRVPSKGSALRKVADLLPTTIMELADGVSHELDEATAAVEAEGLIPLANIISGRGFAADRALGGWVPLQRRDETPSAGGFDDAPPLSLWMQMYALPDHEGWRQQLEEQLEREIREQPGGRQAASVAPGRGFVANESGAASGGPRRLADVAAASGSAPRWGPPPTKAAPQSDLLDFSAGDLVDVSLDEDHPPASAGASATHCAEELLSLEPVDALPMLGSEAASGAKPSPPTAFGFIASSQSTLQKPGGPTGGSSTSPSALMGVFESATASPSPSTESAGATVGTSSAFGFLSASPGSSSSPSVSPGAQGRSSAFGFIAASKPAATLDLASLYSASVEVPKPLALDPVTPARFDCLLDMGRNDFGGLHAHAGAVPPKVREAKSLASWEESLTAGLSDSLRT
mmetsp:Transcript_95579/g.276037  ORF Transcript_95579/g.276037 Transcript_95579/m.276037 type:complete len:511 (-) Transcript_95579:74-1606(-)